jgi:hypothetical protein
MALVTTVGGADSDSYATIAEADAYAEAHGYTAWADLDDDEAKAPALRNATLYMDGHFRGQIKGKKTDATQALAFPRTGCSDEDGNEIDDDVIPRVWKNATIEAAIREADNPGILNPDIERKTSSEKVGPIAVSYEPGQDGKTELTVIDTLVSGLLSTGGSATWGFLARA